MLDLNSYVYSKAEEDNKLRDRIYEEEQILEHRDSEHDQDEAKYSPEEKSIIDKSEVDRTPTPSEDSEEDEGKITIYVIFFKHSSLLP